MTLPTPNYVAINKIAIPEIKHTWSEWDPYELLPPRNEHTTDWLSKTSNRGITAFAIGCAEWVVYRFSKLSSDKMPYDFIDGCWLCVFGKSEGVPVEPEEKDWQGPIRAPIGLALLTIVNVWNLGEFGAPVNEGSLAEQIVVHVIEEELLFKEWRDQILKRLSQFFPRDEENPDGIPIPREILDPKYKMVPEEYNKLIADSVSAMDFDENPFLLNL